MSNKQLKFIVETGVIAAVYLVVTYILAPISFGPLQFRLSEVLTILPALTTAALPGLAIGVFLSNLLNPESLGLIDVVFGTLATVIAAMITYKLAQYMRVKEVKPNLKQLLLLFSPAVIANGLIVGIYLPFLLRELFPQLTITVFLTNILSIAFCEAIVVYLIGIPFYLRLRNLSLFK